MPDPFFLGGNVLAGEGVGQVKKASISAAPICSG
jgi:hypothetical protein